MPPLTESDNEWALQLCSVPAAWALTPPSYSGYGQGKAQGEGITVVHPDTGYTEHPELMQDGRYLIDRSFSRNFLKKWPLPTELIPA